MRNMYFNFVHLKNYSQPESWELHFSWQEFLELQAQKAAFQVTLRELLWRGEGRSQVT